MHFLKIVALICLCSVSLPAPGGESADRLTLSCGEYVLHFSRNDGSILGVGKIGEPPALIHSNGGGLWKIQSVDGRTVISARRGTVSAKELPGQNKLVFSSDTPEAFVAVTVQGGDDFADFSAEIRPKGTFTAGKFFLPGRLTFSEDRMEQVVAPDGGLYGVGFSFRPRFFQKKTGWGEKVRVNAEPYRLLFGAPLNERAYVDPAVPLRVTDEGKKWLPADFAEQLDRTSRSVNRVSAPEQTDLIIVDSANGPFFGGSRLGGKGIFWRFGSYQRYLDAIGKGKGRNPFSGIVIEVLGRLIKDAAPGQNKIGMIDLPSGPEYGNFSHIKVSEWRELLQKLTESCPRTQFVSLTGARDVLDAMKDPGFLAVVNPYGECLPVTPEGGFREMIPALREYVRQGGNWFETAGYSFYFELRPNRYHRYDSSTPPAFADFIQLDSKEGTIALYSVQPLDYETRAGEKDRSKIFIPANISCGGEDDGGWIERSFSTWADAKTEWNSPVVRMRFGNPAAKNLKAFCTDNLLTRPLADKMPSALLHKIKSAVLVNYQGRCRVSMENLKYLPVPSLIHFAQYLHGGFDKQYPDHLPPNLEKYGTPEEFRQYLRMAREMGHVTMPYTNSTFWCDEPRGPTFVKEGEAGLLRNADGTPRKEHYGWGDNPNSGFSTTMWHPSVRRANDETVRQFTEEYPVDILFQDQYGARPFLYDWNPASPTPYAYFAGMIAQIDADSRRVPLSTEGGFAHIMNFESMFCGMTFGLVPTPRRGSAKINYRTLYPPETWRVFPLVQYLAHDKVLLRGHNLVVYLSNAENLTWTLALGFSLNYLPLTQWGAHSIKLPVEQGWLRWLAALQRAVIAPGVGEPVRAFEHSRDKGDNEGFICAQYGPVKIRANLDPETRELDGKYLAPYGFYASAPGMRAGHLIRMGDRTFDGDGVSFVTEEKDGKVLISVYARLGETVAAELPSSDRNYHHVRLKDGRLVPCEMKADVLSFTVPELAGGDKSCLNLVEVVPE